MKKLLLILLVLISFNSAIAQQKGDSLAILYKRVYLYKNPNDLSTRIDKIYSYKNKRKFLYLETKEEHPNFYFIRAIGGEEAFVAKNKVSTDPSLSHHQIRNEIENGSRWKSPNLDIDPFNHIFLGWSKYVAAAILLIILYVFSKKFIKIDIWFCHKSKKRANPLYSRWYIKYALVAGAIIGTVQLFAYNEYFWFMEDGFQIWGNYPSKWDWLIWACYVAFILITFLAILQSFKRFHFRLAISYAIYSFLIILTYFGTGIVLGAVLFVLFILLSGGKKKGGSTGGYKGEPPGTIKNGAGGRRQIKLDDGSWGYFDA